MFYKGIIIDLDNTIYNYDELHEKSLRESLKLLETDTNKLPELLKIYKHISNIHKYEIKNTASSHNKGIYFKHLLEKLNINLNKHTELYKKYWNCFYNNIKPFEGVIEFLKWNKENNIKIGILTDYETEFQVKKLIKLNIIDLIDVIVTSEEVGIEKPSKQMFYTILDKLELVKSEVIMIGDNYEKDILGSLNLNIYPYWLHKQNYNHIKYVEFNNYNYLYNYFKDIYKEINNLKEISKFCGERFDLVQAGGGNSSVKIDDFMFIKASGYNMTNVTQTSGYVMINNKDLKNDILNEKIKKIINYNLIGNVRGSIETYMHSILKKYTIHLHPIQINKILICKNSEGIIKQLFPNSVIIEYLTPGIKVCNKIKEKYNNENIIFLLNHGVIITTDIYNQQYILLNKMITKCEKYNKENYSKYKFVNNISKFILDNFFIDNVTYLCEDKIINDYLINKKKLFEEKITFPDALIYCGIKILFILDLKEIEKYYDKFKELPKIIIYENLIYITSHSLNKCKEIESVLKANLFILDCKNKKQYLSQDEIYFLNNWDAEKYRKLI